MSSFQKSNQPSIESSANRLQQSVLIIGATGSVARYSRQALLAQGWQVTVLSRTKRISDDKNLTYVIGDMFDNASIARAAQGSTCMIFAANIAYDQWQHQALSMIEASLKVCEQQGIRFVFPGNVYVYDPKIKSEWLDNDPHSPVSVKGDIRMQMEQRIQQACNRGAKALIMRAGDWIGKDLDNAWFSMLLSHPKKSNKRVKVQWPSSDSQIHTWMFLPDYCHNLAQVLAHEALQDFEQINNQGHQLTMADFVEGLEAQGHKVKVSALPWWLFKCIAPFNALLKEVILMRYLWQQPLNLKQDRLSHLLKDKLQKSSLKQMLEHCGY